MALKVDNKKKILSFKKMIKSRRVKSTQITISKTNVNSSTSLNPDECNRSCSNNDEKSSSFIKEEIFTKIKHTKPDIEIFKSMFNPSLTEDNKREFILPKIFPKQPPIKKSNRTIKYRKYLEENNTSSPVINTRSINLNGYLSIQKKEQNLNYLAVKKFYKELKPINPFLNNKHINKC